MEPTYTILGGDGQQYGPVTLEQFREWARDGRVGAQTQVWRSDTTAWCAASALPELGVAGPIAVAVPAGAYAAAHAVTAQHDPELQKRVKNGVSWLYWIAGLSLINSIAALCGSEWRFFIGLAITQFIDAFAMELGSGGKIVALLLDLIAAGILITLGFFANKNHGWAAIVGMVLVVLDGALLAFAAVMGGGSLWISVAFHAWAAFMIFRGFQASRELRG